MGGLFSKPALLRRPLDAIVVLFKAVHRVLVRQLRNDVFSGGLVVALAGLITRLILGALSSAWNTAIGAVTTTVDIPSSSTCYALFLRWLQAQPSAWNASHVVVRRLYGTGLTSHSEEEEVVMDDSDQKAFGFLPLPSNHLLLRYNGTLLWISPSDNEGNSVLNAMRRLARMAGRPTPGGPHGSPMRHNPGVGLAESARWHNSDRTTEPLSSGYRVRYFGRGKQVLVDILREGQKLRRAEGATVTEVWTVKARAGLRWYRAGRQRARSISSVLLENHAELSVLADVKRFVRSEKWYSERGIPYRRGYLLEGYPGCGKTSLVTAIAGEMRMPIYMLSLSAPGMSDATLVDLLANADPDCLLLLEDLDAAFASGDGINKRTMASAAAAGKGQLVVPAAGDSDDEPAKSPADMLTFSGLLNAIDGVVAQTGRVLFMTTNHMEKLDPALIRSGRVDYVLHFDLATTEQAAALFTRFYESEPITDLHMLPDGSHASGDLVDQSILDTRPVLEELPATAPPDFGESLRALAAEFAAALPPRTKSMADIQGYLMRHRGRPREAVSRVADLVNSSPSDNSLPPPPLFPPRQSSRDPEDFGAGSTASSSSTAFRDREAKPNAHHHVHSHSAGGAGRTRAVAPRGRGGPSGATARTSMSRSTGDLGDSWATMSTTAVEPSTPQ